MNLTEQQIKLLRWGGLALFFIANFIISMTGGALTENQRSVVLPLLSEECRNYLQYHTEYDLPPTHCEEELRYLVRRINATLKELRDARNDSNLDVPESN